MQACGLILAPMRSQLRSSAPEDAGGLGAGAPGPQRKAGLCGVCGGEPRCSVKTLTWGSVDFLETDWEMCMCVCFCKFSMGLVTQTRRRGTSQAMIVPCP